MEDRGIVREVGERYFLRDTLKYQHCEGVRVGLRCCGDAAGGEDELGGRIPGNISGWRLRARGFGGFLHDLCYPEVTNQRFALTGALSARSLSGTNVGFTS